MVHDDNIAYQRMAHEIAVADRPWPWIRLAEKWMHLFGNEEQAYYCMGQAEKVVSTGPSSVSDLISVAKGWAEIFNRMSAAHSSMANAEIFARSVDHWQSIAESWALDFGDIDHAERCLTLAHNVDKNSYDLNRLKKINEKINNARQIPYSLGNRERLADRDPAYRNMKKAEGSAVTSTEWARLVKIWLQVFNERGNALRCLGKAELAASSLKDWGVVANTWAQEFNDKHQALWCLKQAVAIADSSDEWNTIADNLAAMGYSLRDQALNRKSR